VNHGSALMDEDSTGERVEGVSGAVVRRVRKRPMLAVTTTDLWMSVRDGTGMDTRTCDCERC
jgi:hypothetical protein